MRPPGVRSADPILLYAYAPADLDPAELARLLGDATPLILLNLIGEPQPVPPAGLVQGRKLIIASRLGDASEARRRGLSWLLAVLLDHLQVGPVHLAVDKLGPRARLYSGLAGLSIEPSRESAEEYRRWSIKWFVDRHRARQDFREAVEQALTRKTGVLGLMAAGSAENRPELLAEQVLEHCRVRTGSGATRLHPSCFCPVRRAIPTRMRCSASWSRGWAGMIVRTGKLPSMPRSARRWSGWTIWSAWSGVSRRPMSTTPASARTGSRPGSTSA